MIHKTWRNLVDYVAAERHFSIHVNAGWRKLEEHYKRLDDNMMYVAAVVLHPRMKWRYFKVKWSDREDWLSTWKVELNRLNVGVTMMKIRDLIINDLS